MTAQDAGAHRHLACGRRTEVAVVSTDRLLNIHAVARYLGVSIRTVYRLVRRGELRAFKVGAVWRFSQQDLDAMLARLASREAEN